MGLETTRDEPRWAGLSEVLAMTIPLSLGSMSFAIMRFVDTAMVSRLPGDAPLAAVGTAGLATFTLATFFVGVVGCVGTFVAQSYGRGEHENCARYTWQGIYVALAAGAAVLVFWPLAGPMFRLMPHSDEVTRLELTYFRVRLFGFVFISWQAGLSGFFQGVKRPWIPMYAALCANAVNVVLDYLLIFGHFGFPRWEIGGAALATVIAQGVHVAIMQAVFLSKSSHAQYGSRTAYAIDWVKTRELLRIGWPGGLSLFLDLVNWSVFTLLIVGCFGDVALAAHNAAIQFAHLSFLPALGLNQAIAAIVGQWIGRKDVPRAKARTYTAMRLAVGYMTVVGVTLAVFGKPLIHVAFSQNPEVIQLGRILLIVCAAFQGFDAVNIVLFGALRGVGDTRWMMWTTVLGGYLFFLPVALALAFALGWGAIGAWVGATAYIILLSGIVFRRFHGEGWRSVRIFQRDMAVG